MNAKIPRLGRNDALILNDETKTTAKIQPPRNDLANPSFNFKRMNSALFLILCDLKEPKSTKPSKCSEKKSANRSILKRDAEKTRLNRCLEKEGIFRKSSDWSMSMGLNVCYFMKFIILQLNFYLRP